MLCFSPPPKQPGDLLILSRLRTQGENIDEVGLDGKMGTEGRTRRCFCYPMTEFPVRPGQLPWSLLCRDIYSDTDSDHSVVRDSDKTWPVSGSVLSLFLSSFILWQQQQCMISLLCVPPCWLCVRPVKSVHVWGVWLPSAVGLWTLQHVDSTHYFWSKMRRGKHCWESTLTALFICAVGKHKRMTKYSDKSTWWKTAWKVWALGR